jgi:hypothetical protein
MYEPKSERHTGRSTGRNGDQDLRNAFPHPRLCESLQRERTDRHPLSTAGRVAIEACGFLMSGAGASAIASDRSAPPGLPLTVLS